MPLALGWGVQIVRAEKPKQLIDSGRMAVDSLDRKRQGCPLEFRPASWLYLWANLVNTSTLNFGRLDSTRLDYPMTH